MNKETKIGLAVIVSLLVIFTSVLTYRLIRGRAAVVAAAASVAADNDTAASKSSDNPSGSGTSDSLWSIKPTMLPTAPADDAGSQPRPWRRMGHRPRPPPPTAPPRPAIRGRRPRP